MLKYKYIFHTEAILSNSTRKLLWFEITKMLIAVLKNKLMVLLIIIFGTLSFPVRFGSRLVSVLHSGAVGPGFRSQPRHCRVTVLGKLFTPIVPPFTTLRNW